VHYQNGTTGPARYCTGCAMIAEECPGWLAEATEIASITRVDGDAAHAGDATDEAC
jgi:Pyruvate/2-oxoacid:ferredoxin oxidoreductase delta subunit